MANIITGMIDSMTTLINMIDKGFGRLGKYLKRKKVDPGEVLGDMYGGDLDPLGSLPNQPQA